LFYIGRDMNRLDRIEPANLSGFAPLQKFDSGTMIGLAGIRIADVDGEKFKEAFLRPLPCLSNQRRQPDPMPPASVPNNDQFTHARMVS
jgi:hypothetical protein